MEIHANLPEEREDYHDVSARILRSSNVVNKPFAVNQESLLLKGMDSLQQMKRRREREAENNDCVKSFKERKSTGLRQTTTIDSSKAYGRVTRTASTSRGMPAPPQAQQKALVGRATDRATRVWTR